MIIKDNKLVMITEPKTICFDMPRDVDSNLKNEINFIVRQNDKFLVENPIKNEISQLLFCYSNKKW